MQFNATTLVASINPLGHKPAQNGLVRAPSTIEGKRNMTFALVEASMAHIKSSGNVKSEVRVTTKAGKQFYGPIAHVDAEREGYFVVLDLTPGANGAAVFVACTDVSSIQTIDKKD